MAEINIYFIISEVCCTFESVGLFCFLPNLVKLQTLFIQIYFLQVFFFFSCLSGIPTIKVGPFGIFPPVFEPLVIWSMFFFFQLFRLNTFDWSVCTSIDSFLCCFQSAVESIQLVYFGYNVEVLNFSFLCISYFLDIFLFTFFSRVLTLCGAF